LIPRTISLIEIFGPPISSATHTARGIRYYWTSYGRINKRKKTQNEKDFRRRSMKAKHAEAIELFFVSIIFLNSSLSS